MNRHVIWNDYSESHLLPTNAQHLNTNVVVDADGFAYASCECQQGSAPEFIEFYVVIRHTSDYLTINLNISELCKLRNI